MPMENREDRHGLGLREQAEAVAADRASHADRPDDLSLIDTRRLVHELQVHQVELELQNDELRRAQEEATLAEARRLEGIAVLAGQVAHNFNNLLTTIRGNVELALELDPDGPVVDCLREIEGASLVATRVTAQLLVYSRQQKLEPRLPDLLEAEGPATTSSAPSDAQEELQGGTETLLLVDDEAAVGRILRLLLEPLGYCLLSADSGPAALHVAQAHEGPIHLLVSDVLMPGMNGPELARQLVKERPDTKVLFVSGFCDDVIDRDGLPDGCVHFLGKPYKRQSLAEKVRSVLDGND